DFDFHLSFIETSKSLSKEDEYTHVDADGDDSGVNNHYANNRNCLRCDEVLTKGYSHLDGFQSSGNYCNCDGDDCDVVAEYDDDEDDRDNVGGDDHDGDVPDKRFLF
ncbi:unnamed protein product, partial [Porites evermanni]